jgi:type I restriction enzyme S subunit
MSEWPLTALGELGAITMGQSPDSADIGAAESGLPFLQGCAEFGERIPNPAFYCSRPLRVAKRGSVLISVRAPVGTANTADRDYCIGRGLAAIHAKDGASDSTFLLHAIEQNVGFLHRRSQGSTFLAIGSKELAALPIAAVHFTTQRRIAEILAAADDVIERTEALIAKYHQIKAGLMRDLFTRGVTPDGRLRPPRAEAPQLYKKSSIGWLPEEWEVFAIKAITHLCVDCPHSTPVLAEDGYPMARTSEISDGVLDLDASPRVALTEYQFRTGRAVPTAGDIIFTREAPVGEAFVVPQGLQICLGQRVMLMRPNRGRCDPDFLLFQIYSAAVQKAFLRIVGGTTNPHLNVEDVRNFEIALPSVEEQVRITARLLALDDLITSEKRNGQKLRVSKNGLMHDLLTGRVRVKIEELAAT